MLNDKSILERYIKAGNTFVYPELVSLLYTEAQKRTTADNNYNIRLDSYDTFLYALANGSYNTADYQTYLLNYDQFLFEINLLYIPTGIPLEMEIFIDQLCLICQEKDLFFNSDEGTVVKYRQKDYKFFNISKKESLYLEFPELYFRLYPFRTDIFRINYNMAFSTTGVNGYNQIWGNYIPYTLYLNLLSKISFDYIDKYITTDINYLKKYSNIEANATLFFNNRNALESKIDTLHNNPVALENFKDLVKMVKTELDLFAKHKAIVVNKLESKQDLIIRKTTPQLHLSEEYYSVSELLVKGHSELSKYQLDNPDYNGEKIFQIVYQLFINNLEINLKEIGSYYNNKIYN